jgi:hypothetical protein
VPIPISSATVVSPPAIVQDVDATLASSRRGIDPGAVWEDDRQQPIQAHGGGIINVDGSYYWFGEDRSPSDMPGRRYVACYRSDDLMNWHFRNQVVALTAPDGVGSERWVLERPKVYHNLKTNKFVMYAHVDNGRYALASVGVFISDTVDGEYKFVRLFRPLGLESRDIGQFVDDDGSAYLIFESRPTKGFFIAQLSDDYLDVVKKICFIQKPMEGGALVHCGGLYYIVASGMTGWAPNANKYATAPHLEGPWSDFKDIAPPAMKSYGSQSSFLLKVVGSEKTDVIFMGDKWKSKSLWDSRYLWMPLTMSNGTLALPAPKPWSIDIATGVVTYK